VVALYHIVCRDTDRYRMDMFTNEKTDSATVAVMFEMVCGKISEVDVEYEYLPFKINREFGFVTDKVRGEVRYIGEYDSSDVDAIISYRRRSINARIPSFMDFREIIRSFHKERIMIREAKVYRFNVLAMHIRILLDREHSMNRLVFEKGNMFCAISIVDEERMLLEFAEADRDLEVLINFLPNESVRITRGKVENLGKEELFALVERKKHCHSVARKRWRYRWR
jgi:hypothetical protein